MEQMKVKVAYLYYLQLPLEKRSRGLLPIIQHMKCDGRVLESLEALDAFKDQFCGKSLIEVSIARWVQKRLMKLYIDCCKELREPPIFKLLEKLYNLEVSEDEVLVSDCELQDMSAAPLLRALHAHKTIAVLDLSHNLLGNDTMEKLQEVFTSSSQRYGGLILDLHCNRFGPTALFQICECPVLFARLEVLNISGNRLTDACASYLSTILHNCKALYSLNIEHCSLTSRTIQKVADSLDSGSVLSQLCLGHNNPVSGNSIVNLLAKLATLKRFSELNLNGLKLTKHVVDSLGQFLKASCLSGLVLGGTNIGADGALQLIESLSNGTQELVKFDLSFCGLSAQCIVRFNAEISLISSVIELNLGGNPLMEEGGNALASLLKNPRWCLKILVLSKCELGHAGVLLILQALAENNSLEELNMAGNICLDKDHSLLNNLTLKESSNSLPTDLNFGTALKPVTAVFDAAQQELCLDSNQLEVADSEDDPIKAEPAVCGFDDSCTSSSQKNTSNLDCRYIEEISTAVNMAKQLQLLDLSDNGFSEQVADTLYAAWSSCIRAATAQRHIEGHIIHFSVQGSKCCSMKPCCRRI